MNQLNTGKFIAQCRKDKKLTQRQLADIIGVSDKTVSKWECGNGLPEVSLMLPLCNALGISVNELLSTEKLDVSEYKNRAEANLMNLIEEKQENKKKIILSAIVCAMALASAITLILVAGFSDFAVGWRIALIIIAFAVMGVGIAVGCILDKDAGYFECPHCKTRFVPTSSAYLKGLHGITWRRLKCPDCGKVSNCKKRLTK